MTDTGGPIDAMTLGRAIGRALASYRLWCRAEGVAHREPESIVIHRGPATLRLLDYAGQQLAVYSVGATGSVRMLGGPKRA